jgi:DNA-directed RNA polymerase
MEIPLDLQQQCQEVIEELVDQMRAVHEHAADVELRKKLVEKLQSFKRQNKEYIEISSPIFWSKITDRKHRRKILKRNVMTLPYGGTSYGLGEQQIKDARKHGIPALMHMTHKWGAYMGRTVFDSCGSSMAKPMRLLSLFEKAGKAAEDRGEFLAWTVPKTDFPVVQHYVEGTVKKQWIQYGPQIGERLNTGHFINTYQVSICFIEETKHSKRRQAQGAAPNIIHSLDAAHLMLTIDACPFDITTIHDSFGCLAADMPDLYVAVRETFHELYKENPIFSVMKDIQIDMKEVPCGNLDISLVIDSEYCFA